MEEVRGSIPLSSTTTPQVRAPAVRSRVGFVGLRREVAQLRHESALMRGIGAGRCARAMQYPWIIQTPPRSATDDSVLVPGRTASDQTHVPQDRQG